jgi:hypothetical protein
MILLGRPAADASTNELQTGDLPTAECLLLLVASNGASVVDELGATRHFASL